MTLGRVFFTDYSIESLDLFYSLQALHLKQAVGF